MRILEDINLSNVSKLENDPFDFSKPVNIIGLIANICSIIYAFGPITLMYKIHKKILKPTDTPYLIFVTLILMGQFWISYGILKPDNKFFIILSNCFNVGFNFIYLGLYFYYKYEQRFFKSLLYTIPCYISSCGICLIYILAIANMEVSRYTAMICNILVYLGPGQNLVNKYNII
jgi:solute carrier family 50 protein (sugar transporter)